ncbi:MAG TPA: multicopper oxidase family protein, partial [Longimicrobiales bacterium]|nr:multicopper oxidase family protein [Longimicrobiales bacterium]
ARMERIAGPLTVSVAPDGTHAHEVVVETDGLPDPGTLGPYTTYVAWATSPILRPEIRLGALDAAGSARGEVALDKFLVLVSAEASADVETRTGPLVLRGTSPSMRMQPHELPFLWSAPAGGGHEHGDPAVEGHTGHPGGHVARLAADSGDAAMALPVGQGDVAWTLPPMHPRVPMYPAMMEPRPRVSPFLPAVPPGGAPPARPRELVRLSDGDSLHLRAEVVTRTLRGRTLTMYGFNGQYPGPLIAVEEAATVTVVFENRIELPTAVHWHGVRLENRFDGVPHLTQEPVLPGERFTYRLHFPDPGIYWYHPHHREDIQQELGLYGNLMVRSSDPDYYGPAHAEEVLMLDDLLLAEDGGVFPLGRESATHAFMGRFGDLLLVNGEPAWTLEVARGEVVRLFLTNVSNTRTFNLSLPGARMKLVASDVGRYQREAWVESVVLSPAERYVIDVRFDSAGEVPLLNAVRGIDHLYGNFFPEVDTLGIVTVSGDDARPDLRSAFETLRSHRAVTAELERFRTHFDRPVDHELVLTMRTGELPFPVGDVMRLDSAYFHPVEWTGTMPVMNWASTGAEVEWVLLDPATGKENLDIDWRFRVGDVVKLRLTNAREAFHAMQHPIHLHGQRFLVLAVDGVPNDNLVWKDTILLPVGSSADLLLELSNPGKWMVHCHIAEHLETGMAMVFEVEGEDVLRR